MSVTHEHKTFFDRCASTWHHRIDETSRLRLQSIFMEKIPDLQPPVLDIGSGTGVLLPELRRHSYDNYMIVEADFSHLMLLENRQRNNDYPDIKYVQTDAHFLPFKRHKFNSIVCFAAFAHFINKQHVLSEFLQILNEGGNLVILHLMCHIRLNEMHRELGGAVGMDELPDVKEVSRLIVTSGFDLRLAEEDKNIFLISACK